MSKITKSDESYIIDTTSYVDTTDSLPNTTQLQKKVSMRIHEILSH